MRKVTLCMDETTYGLLIKTAEQEHLTMSAHVRALIRRQLCTPCMLNNHAACEHQAPRHYCACPHQMTEEEEV